MNDFDFYNPTRIIFGRGQISRLDELIPADARVMITYGGSSAEKNGTLKQVRTALRGRTLIEFGGIEPNPQYTTLMKAAQMIKADPVDLILGVGGGSVMDGMKFIALAASYRKENAHCLLFDAEARMALEPVPFGFVTTLPATGSEMNPTGVISYDGGKFAFASENCYPHFSILDPLVTMSLPKRQIVNGIVDTYVHVLEQYLTYPADARFQDRCAEGILLSLIEIAEKTISDPEDYASRANLVWCATMGLNGLIGAGVPQDWSSHMIGHEITALFGVDHAASLAAILPALLRERLQQKREKLIQYGRRVFDLEAEDPEQIALEAIRRTERFFESIGMATDLGAHGIGEEQLELVTEALEAHGLTNLSEHGDLGPEHVLRILQESL